MPWAAHTHLPGSNQIANSEYKGWHVGFPTVNKRFSVTTQRTAENKTVRVFFEAIYHSHTLVCSPIARKRDLKEEVLSLLTR